MGPQQVTPDTDEAAALKALALLVEALDRVNVCEADWLVIRDPLAQAHGLLIAAGLRDLDESLPIRG